MDYWTTQSGEEIAIKDMETSHIENCIKYLQRKIDNGETIQVTGGWDAEEKDGWIDEVDVSDEYKEQIEIFKQELKRRNVSI